MRNVIIDTDIHDENGVPVSQSLYINSDQPSKFIGRITRTRPNTWKFAPTQKWESKCPACRASTRRELVQCINHQLNSNIQ